MQGAGSDEDFGDTRTSLWSATDRRVMGDRAEWLKRFSHGETGAGKMTRQRSPRQRKRHDPLRRGGAEAP